MSLPQAAAASKDQPAIALSPLTAPRETNPVLTPPPDFSESLRDQFLGLTSDFRNGLRTLERSLDDVCGSDILRQTSRALRDAAQNTGLEPLVHTGTVLEQISVILSAVRTEQPAEMPELLAAASDTLGTVEQLLWCVESGDTARQTQLTAMLLRRFPERCRPLFTAAPETLHERLRAFNAPPPALPPSPVTAPAAEPAVSLPLLEAFRDEAEQRFARSEELLVRLERRPDDAEVLSALLREFHTLKGAAAEVGLDHARMQLHAAESLLAAIRDGAEVDITVFVDLVLQAIDSVRGIIDQASGTTDSRHTINLDLVNQIATALEAPKKVRRPAPVDRLSPAPPATPTPLPKRRPAEAPNEGRAHDESSEPLLKRLQALDQQVREYSQITAALQSQLDTLRLVPLEEILRRLVRPARDAARQEGKLVDVEIFSGDLRVDRSLVEGLHGILLHLVRNAVSHGIETSAARQACGKRPNGTVRIQARQHADHLVIRVDDDGAGLDFEAIHAKAEANGWLHPGQLPTRQELARFIFRRGFSTRGDVTDLAGRGVGLDVVAHEIETLNGCVDIESLEGHGTSIRISLPYGRTGAAAQGQSDAELTEPQRAAARLTLVRKKNGTTDNRH